MAIPQKSPEISSAAPKPRQNLPVGIITGRHDLNFFEINYRETRVSQRHVNRCDRCVMVPRLQEHYKNVVVPKMTEVLGYSNPQQLPRLTKIVINMGVGAATQDRKRLEEAVGHLRTLSGQKPMVTKAKKSIAGFKLREGQEIGCMVTLRGSRMFEFFDRLVSLALPRVRDFRGLNPKSFDGRGNYTLGLSELLVFAEIDPDKVHHAQGMHITIVTTATNDNDARVLLRQMGLPMRPDQA